MPAAEPTLFLRRRREARRKELRSAGHCPLSSISSLSYPYAAAGTDAEGLDSDLAGHARARVPTMSNSTSKPQPPPRNLHLHVGTASAIAAATTTNGSAASPGSDSSSHAPARSISTSTAAGGGIGSEQNNSACAACRYQRRKCGRNCLLAPYFPADQQSRFLNAHRLFGVRNLTNTLKRIEPKYGPDAMRSLIYQAEARAADPVGGCVGIIEELHRQIRNTEAELESVRQQIAFFRQVSATDGGLSDPAAMILPAAAYPVVAGQQDDMTAAVAAICAAQQPPIPAGHLLGNDLSSHQQRLYDYFCNNNGAAGDEATSDDDDGEMQQYVVDSSDKAGSPAVALGEQLGRHCQIQASPFVDAFDVKPQVLPPATIQYHGPAAARDELRPRQKKLGPPFQLEHDEDEQMEEQPATAGAPCHLELGFSSSFYNA